MESEGRLTIY